MESPGTAPGSEPRITGAFIAIFPVARNPFNIGVAKGLRKPLRGPCIPCFLSAFSVHMKLRGPKQQKGPRRGAARACLAWPIPAYSGSEPGFDIFKLGQHPVAHFCGDRDLRQQG